MKGATAPTHVQRRFSTPHGHKNFPTMSQRDVGFGGTNSLKKNGSFNNLTSDMPTGGRLLSSSSASSSDNVYESDDEDNEALEQFLAEFERKRSAGEDVPLSVAGSLCFGGMEKLHANALQRLAGSERALDDESDPSAAGSTTPHSNNSSVSSGVSGNWSLLTYFRKGDREQK